VGFYDLLEVAICPDRGKQSKNSYQETNTGEPNVPKPIDKSFLHQ
jgi:hypothetical protein